MKVSYNWSKEFVNFDKTPEELGDDLSLFGHELESIEKLNDDYVLDFEITPNRGDCLSILGIAREISALYKKPLKNITSQLPSTVVEKNKKNIKIKIEDPMICPRFTARIIDNIKIEESPKWIQEKLATYGFRPINNIVDITNYVMVGQGQPLHAFDYDKINDGQMFVRLSEKGEEVVTLDGKNHILPDGALIIEDDEKIYDLAGIMGGNKSEVDEKTKTIVLVGAIYDSVIVRKTSKFLNHITDASYRYERGVDFEGTIVGVDMAASLVQKLLPDVKIGELIDKKEKELPENKIDINLEKINKLLGVSFSKQDAGEYLNRLGFEVNDNIVTVPSYRNYDVKIWQDIAEEIARMFSYNKIEKRYFEKDKSKENKEFIFREAIKDFLGEVGFTEVYSYSFFDKKLSDLLKINDEIVQISNPLSLETEYLRPNILISLLSQIAKNPWSPQIRVFEIGAVFSKENEKWQLALAISGKETMYLEKAIKELNLKCEIKNIDQNILDYLKIRKPVKYIIVDIKDIEKKDWNYSTNISQEKYQKISKYPPTVRDFAFIFEDSVDENNIINEIKSSSENILIVELFDTYYLQNNKKSLAFHIWMQNMSGPMMDNEVELISQNIIKNISIKYQAKLRSKESNEN